MTTPLPPERSLGFQTRRCHRAFDRLLNTQLSEFGLTSGIYYFLRALWQEEGITQRRLCQLNHVTEPTAFRTLNAMVRDGLIDRGPDPEDQRKLRIYLTKKGRSLEAKLMPKAVAINQTAAEGVSASDVRICLRVLKLMSDNLDEELQTTQIATASARASAKALEDS